MTAIAGASALEARLRKTAPAHWFEGSPAAYSVDGVAPSFVVAPDSPEAVAAVLADASKAGAAVIPWGGGGHMGLGMPPERYEVALDLRRLDQVIAYEPADLTVTVQAGARLSDLQARLAAEGQWLPLDPVATADATIGGILAANASGPARVAFGTARDLVIGMTVATAEGQLVKSGGRVVKNVAGYDLAKMHIGAFGTLGLITQVSLKVAPMPKVNLTWAASAKDPAALVALARQVHTSGTPATGIAIRVPAGGSDSTLLLRFAGGEAAVERSRSEAASLAAAAGLSLDQVPQSVWLEDAVATPGTVVLRLVHPQSRSAQAVEGVQSLLADCRSYPTAGVTIARLIAADGPTADRVAALRGEFEAMGGALVIEQAPPELKRKLGVWGSPPPSFPLMRALKEQMDPNRILNPGRYVGGL